MKPAPTLLLSWVVTFIVCIWFGSVGYSVLHSSQPPAPRSLYRYEKAQYQGNKEKAETNTPSDGTAVVATGDSSTDEGEPQPKANAAEWWMVGITAGTLAVALFQLRYFIVQLGIMRDTVDQTQASIEETRKSDERQTRAYVGVDMTDDAFKPEFQTLTVLFKNGGQTPAYDVVVAMEWKAFMGSNVEWPENMPFAISPGRKRSKFTIFQGQEIPITSPMEGLDSEGINFINYLHGFKNRNGATIYFYGTATYRDVFKKEQWSNYCFFLKHAVDGAKLVAYHMHNDAS